MIDIPEDQRRRPSQTHAAIVAWGLGLAADGLSEIVALRCGRPVWPTMVLAGKLNCTLTNKFPGAEPVAEFQARYLELGASATPQSLSLTTPDTPTGGRT